MKHDIKFPKHSTVHCRGVQVRLLEDRKTDAVYENAAAAIANLSDDASVRERVAGCSPAASRTAGRTRACTHVFLDTD